MPQDKEGRSKEVEAVLTLFIFFLKPGITGGKSALSLWQAREESSIHGARSGSGGLLLLPLPSAPPMRRKHRKQKAGPTPEVATLYYTALCNDSSLHRGLYK